MGAAQYALDANQLEGALNDGRRGHLKDERLISPIYGARTIKKHAEDAGVDKCGVAQIDDEIVSALERALHLIAKRRGVREVKFPFQADRHDLIRLAVNANDSLTMLSACA